MKTKTPEQIMEAKLSLPPASQLYNGDSASSYQPMVEAFGNILFQEIENDYQGSTWVLYEEGNHYGYLDFGWGSCSGCDALQGCNSMQEIQDLMEDMYFSIKWFESAAEALAWFEEQDWEGKYSWSSGECQNFVTSVKEYLSVVLQLPGKVS